MPVKIPDPDKNYIVEQFISHPTWGTVKKLRKKYICNQGDITLILKNDMRTNQQITTMVESSKTEKQGSYGYDQTTKVEEARRGKPFTLKLKLTSEGKGELKEKLDAVNRKIRRSVTSEGKKLINSIPYQDNRPDELSARETMLAVNEEKRINVNRLHFGKVKNYTRLLLDNQCFDLSEDGLKINSIGKTYPIVIGEEKTRKELTKYYGRKDTLILLGYPYEKNGEFFANGDLFIQQQYPSPYTPNGMVEVVGKPTELIYEFHFFDCDGKEIRDPYIINVKSWIKEERSLQKWASDKKKEIFSGEDYDEMDGQCKEVDKNYSQKRQAYVNSKIRFCLTRVLEAISNVSNYRPVFVMSFVDFPQKTNSENKDWNFAQNKKLYISKLKQTLTGMAWRHGLEVISLSQEDTETRQGFMERQNFLKKTLEEARQTRDKKEEAFETRQKKATLGKKFKKEHGRKPTEEEKKELFKVLADGEGKLEPSNATLNGEPSVPNSYCNPSPSTDYPSSEKTERE